MSLKAPLEHRFIEYSDNHQLDGLLVQAYPCDRGAAFKPAVMPAFLFLPFFTSQSAIAGMGHDWSTWRHLLYYRFLPNLWRKIKQVFF